MFIISFKMSNNVTLASERVILQKVGRWYLSHGFVPFHRTCKVEAESGLELNPLPFNYNT